MKKVTQYQCEICGGVYPTVEAALGCEALPVVHDRGVKVGDTVLVTKGEGAGLKLRVTDTFVYEPGWGPERYDHSVGLKGDLIDSWGSRQLTFESYEAVK